MSFLLTECFSQVVKPTVLHSGPRFDFYPGTLSPG
jgi:hypothetical protein